MGPGGSIVNISSGAGMRGSPFTGPYAAAKAGMNNLTETLALELAPDIRVNTVAPGPVATEAFSEVLGTDGQHEAIAVGDPARSDRAARRHRRCRALPGRPMQRRG